MPPAVTEFRAACPRGHPDALWRCWRTAVCDEAGDDYLGGERTAYQVVCGACEPVGAAPGK